MITRLYSLFLMVGAFILASILSYYMNIRFDQKAVRAFLKSKMRTYSRLKIL
jgi:hypothetical protein